MADIGLEAGGPGDAQEFEMNGFVDDGQGFGGPVEELMGSPGGFDCGGVGGGDVNGGLFGQHAQLEGPLPDSGRGHGPGAAEDLRNGGVFSAKRSGERAQAIARVPCLSGI